MVQQGRWPRIVLVSTVLAGVCGVCACQAAIADVDLVRYGASSTENPYFVPQTDGFHIAIPTADRTLTLEITPRDHRVIPGEDRIRKFLRPDQIREYAENFVDGRNDQIMASRRRRMGDTVLELQGENSIGIRDGEGPTRVLYAFPATCTEESKRRLWMGSYLIDETHIVVPSSCANGRSSVMLDRGGRVRYKFSTRILDEPSVNAGQSIFAVSGANHSGLDGFSGGRVEVFCLATGRKVFQATSKVSIGFHSEIKISAADDEIAVIEGMHARFYALDVAACRN